MKKGLWKGCKGAKPHHMVPHPHHGDQYWCQRCNAVGTKDGQMERCPQCNGLTTKHNGLCPNCQSLSSASKKTDTTPKPKALPDMQIHAGQASVQCPHEDCGRKVSLLSNATTGPIRCPNCHHMFQLVVISRQQVIKVSQESDSRYHGSW